MIIKMQIIDLFVVCEISLISTLAFAMLLWAAVTEGLHRSDNIHQDIEYNCPTDCSVVPLSLP
jgi:hypothetical protein